MGKVTRSTPVQKCSNPRGNHAACFLPSMPGNSRACWSEGSGTKSAPLFLDRPDYFEVQYHAATALNASLAFWRNSGVISSLPRREVHSGQWATSRAIRIASLG